MHVSTHQGVSASLLKTILVAWVKQQLGVLGQCLGLSGGEDALGKFKLWRRHVMWQNLPPLDNRLGDC